MSPDAPTSQPYDLADWLSHHPIGAIWVGAFCLWVSVSLIVRMWVIHRRAAFLKKFLWSFVLFIPLFGWLLYGGLFHVPGFTDVDCPTEHSRDAPYIGSDHL